MLTLRQGSIRRRLLTFEENLGRARALANFALEVDGPDRGVEILTDLKRSAVVFAVGSVDELCKGVFVDTLIGYVTGDFDVPELPKARLPVHVARTLRDAESIEPPFSAQMDGLATAAVHKFVERDNFQSFSQISTRFSECGLGKFRDCFDDAAELKNFKTSLTVLAEIRHATVHRVGLVDMNGFVDDDEDAVRSVIDEFDEHLKNISVGARRMIDYVILATT